jgi:hypothetical protein
MDSLWSASMARGGSWLPWLSLALGHGGAISRGRRLLPVLLRPAVEARGGTSVAAGSAALEVGGLEEQVLHLAGAKQRHRALRRHLLLEGRCPIFVGALHRHCLVGGMVPAAWFHLDADINGSRAATPPLFTGLPV